MKDIDINDYDYDLPADRIAQYPVKDRDKSKLLIYQRRENIRRYLQQY
jgi:S-adenosylmethionine:tRNA ribosyltransferase-isomerase